MSLKITLSQQGYPKSGKHKFQLKKKQLMTRPTSYRKMMKTKSQCQRLLTLALAETKEMKAPKWRVQARSQKRRKEAKLKKEQNLKNDYSEESGKTQRKGGDNRKEEGDESINRLDPGDRKCPERDDQLKDMGSTS